MTVFDRFRPSLVFLGVSGMAGEKTAHRPPSRLALSPPSKIKAPWRFFTRPGKNPSLSEIPYQSPKKCLKTQITTFSILKFSPKAKNTPVLAVFTLFLPSSYCSHHHPAVCLFEDSTERDPTLANHHRVSFCQFSNPQSQNRPTETNLQHFSPFFVLFAPFQRFHRVLSNIEIPQIAIPKVPQKRFVLKFFSEFVLVF